MKKVVLSLYLLLLFKFIFVVTIHFVNFCKMILNLQHVFISSFVLEASALIFSCSLLTCDQAVLFPFVWEKMTAGRRLVCSLRFF